LIKLLPIPDNLLITKSKKISPNWIVGHLMFLLMKCQNIETVLTLNHATNERKQALKWNEEAKNIQVLFYCYSRNYGAFMADGSRVDCFRTTIWEVKFSNNKPSNTINYIFYFYCQ